MVRERKQKPGKEQLQVQEEEVENIEIVDEEIEAISEIEIEITQKSFFSASVTQLKERFASSHLGQLMLRKCDGLLKVLEDTAKWSLPHDNNKIKLRRPLPWIFFLTLIVSLRTLRAFLTVGFCLLGLRPISPEYMVYYIQSKRRQLRAIRVGGLKAIESRKSESPDGSAARTTARITAENSKENTKFIKKLTTLLGSAICQPRQTCELHTRRLFMQDVKDVENLNERSSKRPRDNEEDALHNLTVSEMLDKYADESSENDSDYIPKEEENADDDEDDDDEGSSTSHISTSSTEETVKENKSTGSENDNTESQKVAEPESIKENGETQYEAKLQPLAQNQLEIHTIMTENDNEQMHTPKEVPEVNGAAVAEGQTSELPTAALEVATESSAVITPKSALHQLAEEWKSSKFTPGHETAASQKPLASTTTNAAGSFQDFHSIFHPASVVKTPTDEAQTSTPTEADHYGSSTSKAVPSAATGNPKKNANNSAHNKYYNYYNGKSRTKSYR